ncbi:MAG: Shedu anti-phage system protein SduA domain-containing protein [Candidatus Bathyarchaeia archaeon]
MENYEKLLAENVAEFKLQKFFEENPAMIDPRVKRIFPKKSLGGENIPDLIVLLPGPSYLVVEIEKPGVKLFTRNGDPTADLTHAQQQVRNYLSWIVEESAYFRKRGFPNISTANTRGLVIIGTSSSLNLQERRMLEFINSEVQNRYEIKTFDKVCEDYKTITSNFKKEICILDNHVLLQRYLQKKGV